MALFEPAPVPDPLAVDDRGTPVAPLRAADVRRAGGEPDSGRAALARRLESAIAGESRRMSPRRAMLTVVLIAGWIALQVFIAASGLSRTPFIGLTAFFGGLVLVSLLLRGDARRSIAESLAATAVAEGVCGACCYSLRELPVEPDGCVVCPECGAAWKQLRITRPFWLVGSHRPSPRASRWPRWLTMTPRDADLLAPDFRGRMVRILDSRLFLMGADEQRALGEARVREIVWQLRAKGRWLRALIASFPASLAALMIWEWWGNISEGDWDGAAILVALALISALLAVAAFRGNSFLRARRVARILHRQGLCPSCGRPLDAGSRAEDGLTECAGCGAAWEPPAADVA